MAAIASSRKVCLPIQPAAPCSRHEASTARRVSAVSITTSAPAARIGAMRSIPLPTPSPSWMSSNTHCGRKRRACSMTSLAVGPSVISTSQPRAPTEPAGGR